MSHQHLHNKQRRTDTSVRLSAASALLIMSIMLGSAVTNVAMANGEQRTRAQAIEIAKQRSGDGRVLSVNKKVDNNGVAVFAVKIISNGRVKVYTVREFK